MWLRRMLGARHFVPVAAGVLVVLVSLDVVVALAWRAGWRPPLLQSHPAVLISGPGTEHAASIQAYVLGAVRTPGVYTLPEGGRVRDLVAAAGGLLADADLARVDLAARVVDGQEVYVPHVGEVVPVEVGGKLNINRASAEQMHDALGISLTIARRIVAYRASHGSFTAVSQLLLVPMSRATYDRMKDLVTV
ncbi:MAG TPA: SLBB domain-containing protein [Ktedonobacterales bacterium]